MSRASLFKKLKDNYFEEEDSILALSMSALSNPARLSILRKLKEKGVCICGEVVEVLPLSQSTVSQHLKVLKESGFIQGRVSGVKSCYCLDLEGLREFREKVNKFFDSMLLEKE